jgi:hypothetical protein
MLLQPTVQPILSPETTPITKNHKRMKVYYDLGKQYHLEPDKQHNHSMAIQWTAKWVYNFYQFIGEQHIGQHETLKPSFLCRLSNKQFEDFKLDTLTSLITFGGPQAGEGDDLLSFWRIPII